MLSNTFFEEIQIGKATRILALGFLAVMIAFSLVVLVARPAHAAPATFTVNSTADDVDTGGCQPRVLGRPFDCTLREAINAANSNSNPADTDLIRFGIPGAGPHTISPTSELPALSQPVTIDGYTEAGASPNSATDGTTNAVLMIVLSGASAPSGSSNGVRGLVITGGGTTVRGLVVNNFKLSNLGINGEGISVRSDNNVIEGNFVGTDVNGTADQGNQGIGILVSSGKTGNIIGGTTPAARNLSSGNGFSGVEVDGSSNTVQGNLLGTQKDGVSDLGNDGRGVLIQGANNTVGGGAAATNTIAFNGLGVSVRGSVSTGNRILRNSIFSNSGFGSGLGIDLNEDGGTANDGGTQDDADTGPNGLQNKPTLTSATTNGTTTIIIDGRLDTKPNETFTLEFFSQGSGNEGKTFIGRKQLGAAQDPDGDGLYEFPGSGFRFTKTVAVGQKITATATGTADGTSEFSATKDAVAAAP
jgi:CSLREA domain-containing protein